jgi:hypothetical protein
MVRCCCAMLAQMNQKMVNMNTTMSLTAIDKRLMMKQAIALALLMLSQWCALTVMWWCGDVILVISISPDSRPDFGDAPIRPNQTGSIGIRPDQLGSGLINQDWAQSGAQFWWWPLEIQELTFPQKCC